MRRGEEEGRGGDERRGPGRYIAFVGGCTIIYGIAGAARKGVRAVSLATYNTGGGGISVLFQPLYD